MAAPVEIRFRDRTEVHPGLLYTVDVRRCVSENLADFHAIANLRLPDVGVVSYVGSLSRFRMLPCFQLHATALNFILALLQPV